MYHYLFENLPAFKPLTSSAGFHEVVGQFKYGAVCRFLFSVAFEETVDS
jgi:hypothetical protein